MFVLLDEGGRRRKLAIRLATIEPNVLCIPRCDILFFRRGMSTNEQIQCVCLFWYFVIGVKQVERN
jgi:hypothetical protein